MEEYLRTSCARAARGTCSPQLARLPVVRRRDARDARAGARSARSGSWRSTSAAPSGAAVRPRDRRRARDRARLGAPARAATFADIARVGPIAHQGRRSTRRCATRRRPPSSRSRWRRRCRSTRRSTLERRLRDELGPRPGRVVVNALCRTASGRARRATVEAALARRERRARAVARAALRGGARRARARAAPSASSSRGCADGLGRAAARAAVPVRPRRSTATRWSGSPTELERDLLMSGDAIDACSPASACASAPAPAASARRRPPPRSRWAWRRAGCRSRSSTIDPAQRLADALGLDELGNEPHRVDPERLADAGLAAETASCGR